MKMLVLGAGESGVGAALLAKHLGYEVVVSDGAPIKENFKQELLASNIEFEEGHHDPKTLEWADQCVKSPGIPDEVPAVKTLKDWGKLVISEVEFAWRHCKAPVIAITGSNGKTTTTSLVYHLFVTAGLDAGLGGNIGRSFCRLVMEPAKACYVLELSSFQLDGIVDFRPKIALLLNITPDHLDRYHYRLENYVRSKFRINKNQAAADLLIFNGEDDNIKEHLASFSPGCRMLAITSDQLKEKEIRAKGPNDGMEYVFDLSKSRLKGRHNYMNALFAVEAALEWGLAVQGIQKALESFQPIPHRMEPLTSIGKVEFINDSKATNVDSVFYALQAMDHSLVWIAGGQDKGNDYSTLDDLVKQKVRIMICLGADNRKLMDHFGHMVDGYLEAGSAKQAVEAAYQLAKQGEVVLLSPACASFDLFKNYEDRGNQFKKAVLDLKESLGESGHL